MTKHLACYFRKPSGYKLKEMTGSGIFAGSEDDATSESKTGLRVYQVYYYLNLNFVFCMNTLEQS